MKKILILGSSGMLGSLLSYDFIHNTPYKITLSFRSKKTAPKYSIDNLEFDVFKFLKNPENFNTIKTFDYIINCIGIIKPYCLKDSKSVINAIEVNSIFPHKLSEYCSDTKIIQIATDCVYSGHKGNYVESDPHDPEDIYGKTKSLGEVSDKNFLNIRCSIIGPETKSYISLLEWFLHQPENSTIEGYDHHYWNGVTTLQFSQLCQQIISENNFDTLVKVNGVHHYLPNKTVSKYELLKIFSEIFNKKINIIKKYDANNIVDRTLSSTSNSFEQQDKIIMEKAIQQLYEYLKVNKLSIFSSKK